MYALESFTWKGDRIELVHNSRLVLWLTSDIFCTSVINLFTLVNVFIFMNIIQDFHWSTADVQKTKTQLTFTCSKWTIEIQENGVFIVNFEHISNVFLVFLLLTLNKEMLAGDWNNISRLLRFINRKKLWFDCSFNFAILKKLKFLKNSRTTLS